MITSEQSSLSEGRTTTEDGRDHMGFARNYGNYTINVWTVCDKDCEEVFAEGAGKDCWWGVRKHELWAGNSWWWGGGGRGLEGGTGPATFRDSRVRLLAIKREPLLH